MEEKRKILRSVEEKKLESKVDMKNMPKRKE